MSQDSIPGLDAAVRNRQDRLGELTARQARLAEEAASVEAEISLIRSFLDLAGAMQDGAPGGGDGEPETAERAALSLVRQADSPASQRAERGRIREAMRSVPRRKAWRPEQVAELIGCPGDRNSVRLCMNRMVEDGELVLSSYQRYRLPPEEPGARKETPAV